MARAAVKQKYTGQPFVSLSGKKVATGDEYSMKDWADIIMKGYPTLISQRNRGVYVGLPQQEAFDLAIRNVNGKNDGITKEWTYTGPEFIADNGVKVMPGDTRCLAGWLTHVELARSTYDARLRRNSYSLDDPQLVFNKSISTALNKNNHATSAMDLTREQQKKGEETRDKRTSFLSNLKKHGTSLMQVLKCRQLYPDLPCSPCGNRIYCYGEEESA